jgi:transposase
LNSKLNVVCDGDGKPLAMMLSEGQMSDHTGTKHLYSRLPPVDVLIADKGYDSDEFREALAARNIKVCIPPKRNRKIQYSFDKQLYKTRHKIENMFGRLKDWRRISTRYDRCAHTFFSAICIAAAVIFYLNQ